MPFKIDPATGAIIVQDVNGQKLPVFVHADGKETPFDGDSTIATISRLNGEAKSHRERAEAAEGKLKPFEGIEDPAAARKALETVKNLDDKKLVDAGQVETIKNEAIKAVRAEFEPVVAERDKLKGDLYGEKIGGAFARSKTIAEKFAIPADLVQARFGSAFKVEEGKTVAYDGQGNKIYSKSRPGELADFDEALETLVDQYPYKDSILKGSGASGGGASGGNPGAGGKKTLTRAQLEAIPSAERGAALKDATLVD
ncbi:hypothetical protein CY658_05035 [Variovorax sp. RO1]|uniref:DUF6651 domain-containing protein n=1 Tax=Variovorax sp. RO1 TaxID=2066034 RepID=UPI000C718008|nr:DUF6651 domain-containing protein [Variovorax sp. RO1]PLC07590.1 hypothetical protein CY658_05035 [Variovorax sp. RO1]